MNVFICRTIFQAYYASIIIDKKALKDIFFVYLAEGFSERECLVLQEIGIDYVLVDGDSQSSRVLSQLKLLHSLKKKIRQTTGALNLFLASIDDPFIQTIISKFDFDNIYSFDDGTANYIDNSIFFIERKAKFSVRCKYLLMGNRLKNIDEVKLRIKTHYSSNQLSNIVGVDRIENISLLDVNVQVKENSEQSAMNVYLCPNFDEIYLDSHGVRQRFILSLSPQDIVIPHPRDKFYWHGKENYTLCNETLAEKKISELLSCGYFINLFGIANSTQYHYINTKYVKNHILELGTLKPCLDAVIKKQIYLFKFLDKLE